MKIGDIFGRLTVVSVEGQYSLCSCECGKQKRIRNTSLTSKNTRSCGCLQREKARQIGTKTIGTNSKNLIENNIAFNTNFHVITSDKPPKNNNTDKIAR